MDKMIFSISEAAEYLGVFTLTLRNWEKKGIIKSFRTPGGHRRFRKNELDRIMGINGTSKQLTEGIKRLESIDFANEQQTQINDIIALLKDLSKNV